MHKNRCKLHNNNTEEDSNAASLIPILLMYPTAQNATTNQVFWCTLAHSKLALAVKIAEKNAYVEATTPPVARTHRQQER